MTNNGKLRTTMILEGEALEALRSLAAKRNTTISQVIREAITTEKFLDDAMSRGEKVLIKGRRGTREIVFR